MPSAADGDADVSDDLRRGRRALAIRRSRRAAGGFVLAVAVTVSGAYALTSHDTKHTPAANHKQVTVSSAAKIRLVAYTGTQPAGFHITSIPAGFDLRVQDSDDLRLVLARPSDHTPGDSFVGKLVVSLQSVDAPAGGAGSPVRVNGQPGTLDTQDGTKTLVFKTGAYDVNVQAWADLGFTDQQLIQFAEGITVTGNPKAPRG
ncbi:MAG: hypothetical protein DLM58_24185 [Pseudonocardiales bacterium]|nr:MAG: hypothetical protein DLM58_24185 [Pseudonocardiales bacterium]